MTRRGSPVRQARTSPTFRSTWALALRFAAGSSSLFEAVTAPSSSAMPMVSTRWRTFALSSMLRTRLALTWSSAVASWTKSQPRWLFTPSAGWPCGRSHRRRHGLLAHRSPTAVRGFDSFAVNFFASFRSTYRRTTWAIPTSPSSPPVVPDTGVVEIPAPLSARLHGQSSAGTLHAARLTTRAFVTAALHIHRRLGPPTAAGG